VQGFGHIKEISCALYSHGVKDGIATVSQSEDHPFSQKTERATSQPSRGSKQGKWKMISKTGVPIETLQNIP
jgi:hypothetical protein